MCFRWKGDQHRKQRKMLNPVFSTNHMRHMFPIFQKVTHRVRVLRTRRVSNRSLLLVARRH